MLFIGIIKNEDPTSLIDPLSFESVEALHQFLSQVLDKRNFSLSTPITIELLMESLKLQKPMVVNFGERNVSLMMGEQEVIYANTSRFVHVGLMQELINL
ncbi:hypothetical protein [Dyadobacter sp. CY343]|uniref:hypothetical protein n=1 Tax=Dyadobacter sp. CY343 TaxID=2907299 RepID=UPI001F3C8A60|nr:hypothetical protein [Dyadobacter sp. CY343]MCE7061966.1 hypothetical protein [Dyadobacter sp. CY343]